MIILLEEKIKTIDDGKDIAKSIEQYEFFQNFLKENSEKDNDKKFLIEISRNLEYEFFEEGAIILKEGDESNEKMYIIMDGTVSILK